VTVAIFRFSSFAVVVLATTVFADGPNEALFKRAASLAQTVREHSEQLAQVASDERQDRAQRRMAINCLGDLASLDAIRPLMRNLVFEVDIVTEDGPLAIFPAAQALPQFGSNIYPVASGELSTRRSDRYLRVLAFVMVQVEGQKLASLRVKSMIEDTRLDTRKDNLVRLGSLLETINFNDVSQWPR